MTFLRRVRRRPRARRRDDAARDQQGDVRRMTDEPGDIILAGAGAAHRRRSRSRSRASPSSELGRPAAGRVVVGVRVRTAAGGRRRAGADGRRTSRSRAVGRRRAAAGARPRRARLGAARAALVVPDSVARVSLLPFEQLPRASRRSRSADALAAQEGDAVSDRRGAGQPLSRAHDGHGAIDVGRRRGPPRRDRAVRGGRRRRRACTPASSTWRAST